MAEVSKTEKIPSKEEIIDKKKYEANRNFDKKAPATAVDSLPTNEATVLTNNEAPKNEENMNEAKPSEKVIVYYFITTTRCPSCYKIENYTHSCILDKFPNELNSGKMEWKVVNVDEKENAHFIKEYELFTKSVVLSKQVDGKEVKWIKLEKVWDLLGDQKEFYNYIESETRKFIGEIK
ncbi:MAG: nitrophenyl compound nitroreductase subunit ArsF family protein [Acidobacteria bacterium]|nr:nitrophenyl compound nitroreductase subunit ArsF family protein [Acidobacteriota bacterium]